MGCVGWVGSGFQLRYLVSSVQKYAVSGFGWVPTGLGGWVQLRLRISLWLIKSEACEETERSVRKSEKYEKK